MNNTFNNHDKSITELKYKLIYHNKINVPYIIDKIKNTPEFCQFNNLKPNDLDIVVEQLNSSTLKHENNTSSTFLPNDYNFQIIISNFFKLIFKSIFSDMGLYTAIFSDKEDLSFFGPLASISACKEEKNHVSNILNDLLIHCTIIGLLYSLKDTSNDTTTLSGKYHNSNKKGYFECKKYDKTIHQVDSTSKIYQKYNGIYKRLNTVKTNYYSTHILNNMCSINSEKNFYDVPNYLKNIALFLLSNKELNLLCKNIHNNSQSINLIISFTNAYNSYKRETYSYNNILDQFIFNYYIEFLFGFETSNHICSFLECIKSSTTSNYMQTGKLKLELLNNKEFLSNMSLVLKCPAIEARDNLLTYAIFYITNTRNFNRKYLNIKNDVSVTSIFAHLDSYNERSNNADNNYLLSQATKHFKEFFTLINNVTIPLLEELWLVVTSELFLDSSLKISDVYAIYLYYNLNKKNHPTIDYASYTPSTRKLLRSLIYETCNVSRINFIPSSLTLYPAEHLSTDDKNFIYRYIQLITNYLKP